MLEKKEKSPLWGWGHWIVGLYITIQNFIKLCFFQVLMCMWQSDICIEKISANPSTALFNITRQAELLI